MPLSKEEKCMTNFSKRFQYFKILKIMNVFKSRTHSNNVNIKRVITSFEREKKEMNFTLSLKEMPKQSKTLTEL